MGMLQLKGVVSGFGKGLQQGLQQTQQYMSQSLLLEERDKNERERLKLTFAHDEGMLQKRAAIEGTAADKLHSRTLERDEAKEDFELRKGRIERDAARTDEGTKYDRLKERDAKTQENAVTNKVLDASYYQQKDATKAKQDRAKEERGRADKRAEMEHITGRDIALKTMELQKPGAAGSASGAAGKLDPNVNATLKVYDQELKDLGDELNNVMTKPDRAAAIQKRMEVIRNEQFKLLGRSRGEDKPARKPIIFPE